MVPECYPGQSKGSILRKAADYIRRIQACGGSANASSQSPATVKMEPLEEAAEQAANSLSEAVSDESSIDSDAASVADVPSEVVTTPSPSADKRKAPSDENAGASESVEETAALDSDLTRDSKRPRIEGESWCVAQAIYAITCSRPCHCLPARSKRNPPGMTGSVRMHGRRRIRYHLSLCTL